jgi:acyl-CoA thioester hydrolase
VTCRGLHFLAPDDAAYNFWMLTHTLEIRVRYQETDGQGIVHHANYLTWLEQGRVELLRAAGHSYRELEEQGVFLVVAEAKLRYFLPARFDDTLRLVTTTVRAKGARIEHHYQLFRGAELLLDASTVVACITREGRASRLPEWLRMK